MERPCWDYPKIKPLPRIYISPNLLNLNLFHELKYSYKLCPIYYNCGFVTPGQGVG